MNQSGNLNLQTQIIQTHNKQRNIKEAREAKLVFKDEEQTQIKEPKLEKREREREREREGKMNNNRKIQGLKLVSEGGG